MRIIGIDSGLLRTGWGIIEADGAQLRYINSGIVKPSSRLDMGQRLFLIHNELRKIVESFSPELAVVEEVFSNQNPSSTMKLGMARGSALLTLAQYDIDTAEYAPNTIKKALVGRGHAGKEQVAHMVAMLLPQAPKDIEDDITDALAAAICHAHHVQTSVKVRRAG